MFNRKYQSMEEKEVDISAEELAEISIHWASLMKSKDDGDDRLEGGETSEKIFGGLDQTLLMEEKEKMLRSMLEILPIINLIERKTRLQFKTKERD